MEKYIRITSHDHAVSMSFMHVQIKAIPEMAIAKSLSNQNYHNQDE